MTVWRLVVTITEINRITITTTEKRSQKSTLNVKKIDYGCKSSKNLLNLDIGRWTATVERMLTCNNWRIINFYWTYTLWMIIVSTAKWFRVIFLFRVNQWNRTRNCDSFFCQWRCFFTFYQSIRCFKLDCISAKICELKRDFIRSHMGQSRMGRQIVVLLRKSEIRRWINNIHLKKNKSNDTNMINNGPMIHMIWLL